MNASDQEVTAAQENIPMQVAADTNMQSVPAGQPLQATRKKYCRHCGEPIDEDCVVCPKCGKQVEQLQAQNPNIVINNQNVNTANAAAAASAAVVAPKVNVGRRVNKWTAFFLCLFLGFFGAHKFYEGKTGMGILYLFTLGLCGIGWFVDLIVILTKPNPYYV